MTLAPGWALVLVVAAGSCRRSLERQLGSGDPLERQAAIRALAEDGVRSAAQVPTLVAALTDPRTQIHAALALGEIGPAARSARRDLLSAAQGPVAALRAAALLALARIAGDDPEVMKALGAATHDPDPLVRKVAGGMLARDR